MKWAAAIDLLVVVGIATIALGPAVRWLHSDNAHKVVDRAEGNSKSVSGVIIWTAIALALALWASFSRGEKLRHACRSFQEQMGVSKMSDDQIDTVTDSDWWAICNPDENDSQE